MSESATVDEPGKSKTCVFSVMFLLTTQFRMWKIYDFPKGLSHSWVTLPILYTLRKLGNNLPQLYLLKL